MCGFFGGQQEVLLTAPVITISISDPTGCLVPCRSQFFPAVSVPSSGVGSFFDKRGLYQRGGWGDGGECVVRGM